MTTHRQIEKEKQLIARCENSLALEKLKKRKAETRRKIELGGLVVKAGVNAYNQSVVLGALVYAKELIEKDNNHVILFENKAAPYWSAIKK